MAEEQTPQDTRPAPQRETPTDKMLAWARTVAERCGETLTTEQETDFEACKAFLDDHAGRTPPSQKQIDYAERLAESEGVELPEDALTDYRKMSAWLDEHAGRG